MSVKQQIARSTGILSLAIGLSRVLGFVRDLLLARLFGTTLQAQAFVVAFRIPNVLRDLVAEGAVTAAVVPVLSGYRAAGSREAFWRLSDVLLTRLAVFLALVGLAGAALAPQIVRITAPGFVSDPEQFALTVTLTRILFPFITLVGLWAYFMGVLNTLGHFGTPALGSAILNLSMIAACLWVVPWVRPGILAVAIGVLVGGLIQLVMQLPVAGRLGFRWRWAWRHPGAGEVLRMLGPRVVGSAAYQANVLVHTALASLQTVVGQGAVAALYFANRLVQLPLALFGTASAQASLPSLSEQAAQGDLQGFRSTLLGVMRMNGFVSLPAAVGLFVLAFPIVGGLFERGQFDHAATVMTSQAIMCYAGGLLFYAATKVLSGAFYALKDTRTPVRLAFEAMAVNVGLSLALMWPLRVNGLALAASLSTALQAYRLTRRLEVRLGTPILNHVAGPLARMGAASGIMGLAVWVLWQTGPFASRPWLGLPIVIAAGVGCYAASCRLIHVGELATVLRWLNTLPPLRRFAGR